MTSFSRFSKGTTAGLFGSILGLLLSSVFLFVPLGSGEECTVGGECHVVQGPTGIDYLLGVEGADPALFFWSMFVLGFVLVGGYGAWTETRFLVWLTALALFALTVLGVASIGLFIAPAALLFLLAGIWLRDAHTSESAGRSPPRS
jgi:hypothetical protein